MNTRILALIAAVCVVASLFFPWVSVGFGESVVPWDSISQMSSTDLSKALESAPLEGWVFAASFVLSAVFVLATVLGIEGKALAILAGAAPVGLVGWGLYSVFSGYQSSGLPIPPMNDLSTMASEALKVFGAGLWAWIGGGTALFVLGIFDSGRSR